MLVGRLCGGSPATSSPSIRTSPGGRLLEPGDHPQRRRLAAARGAEQGEELAAGDLEVHLVAPRRGRRSLGDALQLDARLRCLRGSRSWSARPSFSLVHEHAFAARPAHGDARHSGYAPWDQWQVTKLQNVQQALYRSYKRDSKLNRIRLSAALRPDTVVRNVSQTPDHGGGENGHDDRTAERRPRPAPNLQELAQAHLWMHFTRMGGIRRRQPRSRSSPAARAPTSTTSTASATSTGSRPVLRQRRPRPRRARRGAARQVEELDFYIIWSYAHPRAIELAERIAALAPGDLNRVFFTSGGSEAVESAIKLARAYHQRTGKRQKIKFLTREVAYHGTTLGALQATGITALRSDFEPLVPGGSRRRTPTATTGPRAATRSGPPTRSRRRSSSRGRRRSPR